MAINSGTFEGFVVTDGEHQYDVIRPWQKKAPDGSDIGLISQLALDRHGRVFVLQRTAPHLRIYTPDGQLERSFEHPQLTSGHGLHIDAQDRIWITTYDAHQVLVFDADLRLLMELGGFNQPRWQAPFNHPTGVHVGPDGSAYVSDGYGNACVHRFSPDGHHLQSWGRPGTGPGEFNTPHAVWVLPDGRVLCSDRDNDRIQVFDADGQWLATWGGLIRPMALWATPTGEHLFVSEQVPRISRLDTRDGRVLGRARAFGIYAHGMAGDAQGNLFVAEQGASMLVAQYRRRPSEPRSSAAPTDSYEHR